MEKLMKLDNVYSKINFTLIVSICITILTTYLVLYFLFEKHMQYQLFVSESENLAQASYSAEILFNNAKMTARQVYYDKDFSSFRYNSDVNSDGFSNTINKLESYRYLTDFIHSIYIFGDDSSLIYSTAAANDSSIESAVSFFDKEAVAFIRNYSEYPFMVPIPRKIPISSPESQPVFLDGYTFVYYENPGKSMKLNSAVVINIDESWMKQMLSQLSPHSQRDTFIINNHGQTVINSKDYEILSDLSDKAFVKKALSLDHSAGYFTDEVNGEKSLVIYVPFEQLGWTYIRTIPYHHIMEKVNEIKHITIVATLAILLAAVVLAIFQSRKLSHPIDRALSRLKRLENDKRNEFFFLQQEYMRGILSGKVDIASDRDLQELKNYKISLRSGKRSLLLLFSIDHYHAFCSRYHLRDRELLKFGIMNINAELFGAIEACDVVDVSDHAVLVILSENDAHASLDNDSIYNMAQNVQQQVWKYLQLSLSCFISPSVSELSHIPQVYNDLYCASEYKLLYGPKCILYSDHLKDFEGMNYVYPANKAKALIHALISGNTDEAKRLLDEILDEIRLYSVTFFGISINRLVFSILGAVANTGNSTHQVGIHQLVGNINRMEYVEDIRQAFHEIFDAIEETNKDKKRLKYDIITEKIIDLIAAHYGDPNLSVQWIAEAVGFSPTYTSRLFKQMKAQSINDYVNEVRVMKARELLLSTNLNGQEIAQRTGFTNTQYFHKVFKKFFGMTPKEMRKQP